MNDNLYRHVLLKDLKNYLSKEDYLGGYTSTLLSWVRKNIGAVGYKEAELLLDRSISAVKHGTYKEILDLVNNKELVPGFIYIITDFLTLYESHEKNAEGKYITWGGDINPSDIFNILLIAYSENLFLKRATIINEDGSSLVWDVLYNFESRVLDDGLSTKGDIIYLQDDNFNKANYDFKNIKFANGYVFELNGLESSSLFKNNDVTNAYNISFKQVCNNCNLSGSNIIVLNSIDNLTGCCFNVCIDTTSLDLLDSTIKLILNINDSYYLDYLDLKTLTHLFYEIDTIL